MITTTPDEQGWYWVSDQDGEGWRMAFVSTFDDKVKFYGGESGNVVERADLEDVSGLVWYGPFACPGGDFGGMTIEKDYDLYRDAKQKGKAIVIEHVDFKFCEGEGVSSQITITSLMDREEARKVIYERSGS